MLADFTETFEKQILPVLRKQKGFQDEITFSTPEGTEVCCDQLVGQQRKRGNLQQQQHLPGTAENPGKSCGWNA